jgi:hypothetical protein
MFSGMFVYNKHNIMHKLAFFTFFVSVPFYLLYMPIGGLFLGLGALRWHLGAGVGLLPLRRLSCGAGLGLLPSGRGL